MKKYLSLPAIIVLFISLLLIALPAKSRLASYYSGDAISYNNEIYITTSNTGSLEVFRLKNNKLSLLSSTHPYDDRSGNYIEFFDSKLVNEDGHLYVYGVSNYTIYKYEVLSDSLSFVKKLSNTYWEWYNRIDKLGNDLVTISAKGIKTINSNLDVVSTSDFKNTEAPYNISGDNSRFFLSINEAASSLEVYDRESKTIVSQLPLEFKYTKGNRRAYQDAAGYIYVVDDVSAKKFDVSGKLLATFKHLDFQGFDINASGYTDDVYFTNGVGIVKLNKDMKLERYAWTSNLGGTQSWAMGLKVVYDQGDKVIVFNNYNITVLDSNLKKIDSISATQDAKEYASENLNLNLDKMMAPVNSSLVLSGGGYFPYESLNISFAQTSNTIAQTNSRGRFSTDLIVPNLKPGNYDIKVSGDKSKFTYSTSFRVE